MYIIHVLSLSRISINLNRLDNGSPGEAIQLIVNACALTVLSVMHCMNDAGDVAPREVYIGRAARLHGCDSGGEIPNTEGR